jgi:hypothetical protein
MTINFTPKQNLFYESCHLAVNINAETGSFLGRGQFRSVYMAEFACRNQHKTERRDWIEWAK